MNLVRSGCESWRRDLPSRGIYLITIRPDKTGPIVGHKTQPRSLGKLLPRLVLLLAVIDYDPGNRLAAIGCNKTEVRRLYGHAARRRGTKTDATNEKANWPR